MEKFYIVTEKSPLHKEYLQYKEGAQFVTSNAPEFMKSQSISAEEYGYLGDSFYIKPTEADKQAFKNMLCRPQDNGLYGFRKNSKIDKAWKTLLKQNGINPIYSPMVPMYFDSCGGKNRTRLFEIDGVVYCSYENSGNFSCPEGMTEIPASQFFKVIEDEEARRKAS